MTYLFCDTCVLLNLATDIKLYDVIEKLLEFNDSGKIRIVVSNVVKKELTDHKETIVDKRIASYTTHLKNIKNLYELFSKETEELLKKEIRSIQENLPKMEEVLTRNLNELVKLVNKSTQIPFNEIHKNNVIDRAINKTFPFHRNKNSIKDALISEAFIEFVKHLPADCEKIYFVTDNTEDFSDISNKTKPHSDWATNFNETILYSTNIASVINEVVPKSIDPKIEEEIKKKSVNTCTDGGPHHFETENGFWKNSMYGGGLSWHYRCTKCGILYDTGDYWD
jgi:hypothetical protein